MTRITCDGQLTAQVRETADIGGSSLYKMACELGKIVCMMVEGHWLVSTSILSTLGLRSRVGGLTPDTDICKLQGRHLDWYRGDHWSRNRRDLWELIPTGCELSAGLQLLAVSGVCVLWCYRGRSASIATNRCASVIRSAACFLPHLSHCTSTRPCWHLYHASPALASVARCHAGHRPE